jgi:hypothetical protein
MPSAIALARENDLPIIVFSLDEPGGFKGILAGRAPIPGCPEGGLRTWVLETRGAARYHRRKRTERRAIPHGRRRS